MSPQLEKNKTKANKHPGLIVSKLIHLNLLLNPFEMGAGGLPWRDLSVKSNSFCAVNVKVRSACAQLSSQVSSSQPANIQAAAITQHQKKGNTHMLTFRKLDKLSAIDTLGGFMLTLMGAIRIPLSRLQLVPPLDCLKWCGTILKKSAIRL